MTTQEKLAQLHNRTTRYEIVCHSPTGERWLIGYTARPGKPGMMNSTRAIGESVVALTGVTDQDKAKFSGGRTRARLDLGNGWAIAFSGRTQRDAIIEGELPRVPRQ